MVATTPSRRRARRIALAVVASTASAACLPLVASASDPLDGRVTVEIVSDAPGALAAGAAVALAHDGVVLGDAPGLLLVEVSGAGHDRLTELAANVDLDVRRPVPVDVRPERIVAPVEHFGPTAGVEVGITNAPAWHAAGFDGTGVRVGIIDFFDVARYWDPAEHGPLPVAGATARCLDAGTDCTSEFFDGVDIGGEDHGVAVVEVIRDMAPDAEIFIGQAGTLADYQALVDWFAANGVRIVNRSLGSRYDGPGDGRGGLDDIVAGAVARGILWVNSGGNNGDGRYYRHPVRLVGDRVAFGATGAETFLRFSGCAALGGVRWAGDWDLPAAERTDYDVFLWESPTGNPAAGSVVASATRDQRSGATPIENIFGSGCPDPGNSFYLEVVWRGGDTAGDVLEILDYGGGFAAHTQQAYSAAVAVVDARQPGVVAVGAIDPPGSGRLAIYSSRGPTNDGRIAPHVSAPAGFASTVFGTFAGTSASAPVVAGGAALLLDAGLAADADSLGDLIRNTTVDRGAAGPDHVHGYGEFRLPAPPDPAGVDVSPSRFVSLATPVRFLDTREATAVGPAGLVGELWRGEIVELPVLGVGGVPTAGVTAVAVNIVTVDPDRPSYVQALPTGRAAVGGYSNLNAEAAGQTRANFAIIPVGEGGTISLYSIAEGDLVVDVLGWFERADGAVAAGRFVELPTAERLLDTRRDAPVEPLAPNAVRRVPMPTGVDPALVGALVVTVTAANASAFGWLQAFPADRPDVIARTSTVNTAPGTTVANTAIVPVGSEGIAITGFFAGGAAHVVVDAIGYITSSSAPSATAGRFVPVRPARAFDSRSSTGRLDDRQVVTVDASAAPGVDVPDTARGVAWNAAIVGASRPGFLRGWPADGVEPSTSTLNWSAPGETRAGAAITAVDAGRARFRMEDGSQDLPGPVGDLIADVFGFFT